MSALFWAQIKDLTRRVEALEAAEKARSAPQGHPQAVPWPNLAEPIKRGPGRPKKQ